MTSFSDIGLICTPVDRVACSASKQAGADDIFSHLAQCIMGNEQPSWRFSFHNQGAMSAVLVQLGSIHSHVRFNPDSTTNNSQGWGGGKQGRCLQFQSL